MENSALELKNKILSINNILYKYKISKYWDFQKHCQFIAAFIVTDNIILKNIPSCFLDKILG